MSTIRANEVSMLDDVGKASMTFDNLAALKVSTQVKSGQFVRTLGYYEPGDGGGNDYEILAGGTGTADGGSFIDLPGSGLQAKGLFLNGVNVRQFGAVGDGASDDYEAIQAAIHYLEDGGRGGAIYMPSGDYLVNSTVNIVGQAVKLFGESPSTEYAGGDATSRLVWGGVETGNDVYMLHVGDTSSGGAFTRRVHIKDIGFNGGDSVSAIGSVWAPEMLVEGCSFSSVHVAHDCYAFESLGRNYSNTWRDCYFHNFIQFALRLRADCHRSNILECHFTSKPGYIPDSCIRVGDINPSSMVRISGNNFEPRGDDGTRPIHWIDIRQGRAPTIIGNYFEVPSGTSIRSCVRLGVDGPVEGGVTISNRMLMASNAPDYANGKSPIQLHECIGHLITGNHFQAYNGYIVNNIVTSGQYSNQYIGNKSVGAISSAKNPSAFSVLMGATSIFRAASHQVVIGDAGSGVPVRIRNSDGEYVELWPGEADGTLNAAFRPGSDNLQSLGRPPLRWSVVYAGTGTINTSDEREKQQIRSIDATEKAVAAKIKNIIRAFKFSDAVAEKGINARIHFGVIAQEVKAAFEAEGLNPNDYGLLCYDEWEQQTDPETGEVTLAAGNRYGIRYEELLAFMISAI